MNEAFESWRRFYGPGEENKRPSEQRRITFINNLAWIADFFDLGRLAAGFSLHDLNIPPVLVTNRTRCMFCRGADGLGRVLQRKRASQDVNLITAAYQKTKAVLVVAHCYGCHANYHPDRIVRKEGRRLVQFYVYNAQFLRISKPAMLWVDRTLAVSQSQSILQHQTFSGYASWFKKTYGPNGFARLFAPGRASTRPRLTDTQSYRIFVEHLVRLLGVAHNYQGRMFHTNFDPTVRDVVKAANLWFVRDGVLPESRQHTCDGCTQPKRYHGPLGDPVHAGASAHAVAKR